MRFELQKMDSEELQGEVLLWVRKGSGEQSQLSTAQTQDQNCGSVTFGTLLSHQKRRRLQQSGWAERKKEKAQLKSVCHPQPQELCFKPLKELGIRGQDIFEGRGRFAAGEEDGQAPDTWQVEKYLFRESGPGCEVTRDRLDWEIEEYPVTRIVKSQSTTKAAAVLAQEPWR
ncbi:unnamed protein product [Rangifer tarandus platyrhynchus]|uniref:Uncharacterized protein n=1 Tax=Rangifer tarandus platyrhynchus TaxID=3082113 RepID=A0AC59YQX2_RANTA